VKPPKSAPKGKTIVVDDPKGQEGRLKNMGGSQSDAWNTVLANQAIGSLWMKNSDEESLDQQLNATAAALIGIGPQDELESMIAAQLIASHNSAMESFRRAMLNDQTFEGRRENLAQANKLSRTYATLLDALNRHRGKGQQRVTVEHVTVNAGGQAVVGVVSPSASQAPGGGGASKSEDQPHAKGAAEIGHAPEPALWSSNALPESVSVASDAEWTVQNARGKVTRRAEG
jgi:hypothetical protein